MMERPKKASGVEKNIRNLNEVRTEAMQKIGGRSFQKEGLECVKAPTRERAE